MRRAHVLTGSLLLASCATLNLGGGSPMVEVVSIPSGATVRIEGYGECTAPCTFAFDAPRMITVAMAGYKARRFRVEPSRGRFEVALEPVARTSGVESSSLPEL